MKYFKSMLFIREREQTLSRNCNFFPNLLPTRSSRRVVKQKEKDSVEIFCLNKKLVLLLYLI